jgi:chromosome partitioning protein
MYLSGVNGHAESKPRRSAHVIVCGNEKGGSGKSTTAMHIAVALLKAGYNVATIDLDGRQLSLTRYVENRKRWSKSARIQLELPRHFHVPPAHRDTVADTESEEFRQLTEGLGEIEDSHDFVVIDTPGSDTFLNRMAHRIADTLVTPMNDSFVDFDVLARIDPVSHEILELSQYATAVRDARRQRRQTDNRIVDWIVVRNRMANISSRNEQKIDTCLRNLSIQLGFRLADGISERVVFREFFPIGLTALDDFEEHVLGSRPTLSHLAARQEIRQLLTALRLPTDEVGRKRAMMRQRYAEAISRPIAMPDIFVS